MIRGLARQWVSLSLKDFVRLELDMLYAEHPLPRLDVREREGTVHPGNDRELILLPLQKNGRIIHRQIIARNQDAAEGRKRIRFFLGADVRTENGKDGDPNGHGAEQTIQYRHKSMSIFDGITLQMDAPRFCLRPGPRKRCARQEGTLPAGSPALLLFCQHSHSPRDIPAQNSARKVVLYQGLRCFPSLDFGIRR